MLEILSTTGILVSVLLILQLKKETKFNIYLSGFFLTIALFALTRNTIMFNGHPGLLMYVLPYGIPLFQLSAPFLYLYIRKSFTDTNNNGLSSWEYVHFLPAVISFINITPYLFLSADEQLKFAQAVIINPYAIFSMKHLFYSAQFNLFLRPFIGIIYSGMCIYWMYLNKSKITQSGRFQNAANFSWYMLLLGSTSLHFVYVLGLALFSKLYMFDVIYVEPIKELMIIPTLIMILLSSSIFFFPRVIYGESFVKRQTEKDVSLERLIVQDEVNNIFRFSNERLNGDANKNYTKISNSLGEYFATKPYLRPSFTLSVITKETNIPYHQLTNYFNMYLGLNFNDWKNNARVDHAVDLIKSGQAKNLTLESIAYSCGFLSRSNFVNCFRKHMGMNPSEYVKTSPEKELVIAMDF